MTFFNRQPKGIPVGGQFSATAHAEPALTLSAGTLELGTRDSGDMFSAAKDMFRTALQSHRDRRDERPRMNPLKRRLAVAALVLAAATSMTGCSGQSQDCPKAADFPTSSQSVSYTGSDSANITTASFPMKGGGHGGGGHSSGHSSTGHASEGGSAGHATEGESSSGGSSGGSSGSSGPHFWPWSTGSHATQCDAHPETTQAP